MNLKITHNTEYKFSKKVFLEPHTLKFKPRDDFKQQTGNFSISIVPEPEGIFEFIDPEGNQCHMAWFKGEWDRLSIQAESNISLGDHNPMDFLVYPFEYTTLPFTYPSHLPLNHCIHNPDDQPSTEKLAEKLLRDSENVTINFITDSTDYVYKKTRNIAREIGHPLMPDETLKKKVGSCRDLAVLLMYILRSAGIASKFVSGYKYNYEDEDHELHAWVEAYVPGAGWIETDPSTGLLAENDHIRVSSSFQPTNTLPVTGSFRGKADSKMNSDIQISRFS